MESDGNREGARSQRFVADDLIESPDDGPRLRATRCDTCEFVSFPPQSGCPSCGGSDVSPTSLSKTGTLWTWTRQRFQPKNPPYLGKEAPQDFIPFAVGFIELREGRVEARIAGDAMQDLRIGMPMKLTVVPFTTEEDGTDVLTYAFRPVSEG